MTNCPTPCAKRGGVSRARDLKDMGDRELRRILNEENLRRVHGLVESGSSIGKAVLTGFPD